MVLERRFLTATARDLSFRIHFFLTSLVSFTRWWRRVGYNKILQSITHTRTDFLVSFSFSASSSFSSSRLPFTFRNQPFYCTILFLPFRFLYPLSSVAAQIYLRRICDFYPESSTHGFAHDSTVSNPKF